MRSANQKMRTCLVAFVVATGAFAAVAPAQAVEGKQTYSGEYTISFLGLPVAHSTFTSVFNGDNFSVNGRVSSAGVAKLFDSTTGTSSSSGRFVGKTTRAGAFETHYTSGKKKRSTTISFSGGAVTSTVNTPPLKKRKNKVPLDMGDLGAVNDPVSATLIRADKPQEVCNRTLRLYDGEMRADLAMKHDSIKPAGSFDGEIVTCSARFIPMSGYKTKDRAMDYLKSRARISISFAPLGETGIYAPVRATISTTLGPVTVTAKRTRQ
jgi:hypothetical protein